MASWRGWAAAGAAAAAGAWALARARRRIDFAGRGVLITGGSRGLGLAIARRFAAEGAQVALLAREGAELTAARRDLEGRRAPSVLPIVCDVRDRIQVRTAVREAAERFGRLDVVVNDAGVIQVGPLEHMERRDFEEALEVHLYGPLEVVMAALPWLREAPGGGRVVNISSLGGKLAVPHMLPYSASKHALVGLSDGLRAELRKYGILVTTVCPGLMRTGSAPHARFKGRHRAEHAWFAVAAGLPLLTISAERAAARIVEACRRGQTAHYVTVPSRLSALMNELFPGLMAELTVLTDRLLPAWAPEAGTRSWSGQESHSEWAPSWATWLSDAAARRHNELTSVEGRPSAASAGSAAG